MNQRFSFNQIRRLPSARAVAFIGIAAGLAALAGCKVDDALGPTSNRAIVQFINAAARYDSVDLYVDSTGALRVASGEGQSIFVTAQTEPRLFEVKHTGDTTTLASDSFVAADQGIYALILTQHAVGGGLLVLPDTVSVPPSGSVGIRVVNAAPSAGAIDIYLTDADTTLTTPFESSIPFEGVSSYKITPASPNLRMRLTAAGTRNVLLDIDLSPLSSSQVRTIVAVDSDAGGLPLTWLAIPDVN